MDPPELLNRVEECNNTRFCTVFYSNVWHALQQTTDQTCKYTIIMPDIPLAHFFNVTAIINYVAFRLT